MAGYILKRNEVNMKYCLAFAVALFLAVSFCWTAVAQSLENKLSKIIIKKLDVEDAKIKDVFELIRQKSREADPEGKGVNFVFQDIPDSGTVTVNLLDIPLNKLIEYVCISANLKFKIDTHAVIISRNKAPEKKSDK